jgi:hypothetical protein
MAIIPLGPFTIPSMCKLPIISPGLPGGRFSGVPFPVASLANSGENGSRRAMFSFTGTIAGSAAAFGTSAEISFGASAFASAAGLGLGVDVAGLLLAATGFTAAFAGMLFAAGAVAATVLIGAVTPGLAELCESAVAAVPPGAETGFMVGATGRLEADAAGVVPGFAGTTLGAAADVAGFEV